MATTHTIERELPLTSIDFEYLHLKEIFSFCITLGEKSTKRETSIVYTLGVELLLSTFGVVCLRS